MEPDTVYSVLIMWDENRERNFSRLGAYFSLQSARTEASKAKRKGAQVMQIDKGTVAWTTIE